jgi:acyl dehydratase
VSTDVDQLSPEALGLPGATVEFEVRSEAIRDYAAATDDPSPRAREGLVATPMFAIVPVWNAIAPASRSVATEEARNRVVHFSQDMILHRSIEAEMSLLSTAAPVALIQRGSGCALVIHTETRDRSGELVNEQWVTEFFRGTNTPESYGDPPPDHRLPAETQLASPLAEIIQMTNADQADRYADASGDHFAIHLDDEAARAVGLPGRILHGFCTLAFCSRAVSEAIESDEIRRIAARFSAPVFPGDELTTRVWPLGENRYGFETSAASDRTVIKDGLVEFG